VREVIVDDDERQATVIVPDDQLSLAIGRDGQNARLAARLTGWRVDIKSETEFASEETEIEIDGEEQFDGRCMAVLSNGRRCPNATIPGSTYCGLPQHQALSRFETSQTAVLANVAEAEVAILADPDADQGQVEEIVNRANSEFVEPTAEAEEAPAEPTDEVATEEAIEEDIAEEAREAEEVGGETLGDDPEASGSEPSAGEAAPADGAGEEAVEQVPTEQTEQVPEEAEQA
jgi:transcription termination/antitermination protein NusA